MHGDLLLLRRTDPIIRAQATGGVTLDGAVLGPESFVARFFGPGGDDRLLVVNLGARLALSPAPEPLLAPPRGARWQLVWSSEDPRYGGHGMPTMDSDEHGWQIPAQMIALLAPNHSTAHVKDLSNRP